MTSLLPHKWVETKSFRFHQCDINQDNEKIAEIIRKERIDVVVNYAAQSMVAQSWEKPLDWFRTNTMSTIDLHERLRKIDTLQRYIHITTPEVYGNCSGKVTETQAFNPSTPYAVSRAAADMSLQTFFQSYSFNYLGTRAANVYGPGQQLYRIIPKTIICILKGKQLHLDGGGKSVRSFIHIDDVSRATLKIIESGHVGDTYHISTERMISIESLVKMICDLMRVEFEDHVTVAPDRLGKDASYNLDSSKLRNELGWTDQISLEQGLSECIDWVKNDFANLSQLPDRYAHKA